MPNSFVVTGNIPFYTNQTDINKNGIFSQNTKPDFIIFSKINYDSGLIHLSLKKQDEDYLFDKEAISFDIKLDIAACVRLTAIIKNANTHPNFIMTNDDYVKICNTVGENNLSNQSCFFITAPDSESLYLQLFNSSTNSFELFSILGRPQIEIFKSLLDTNLDMLKQGMINFDISKLTKAVPPKPLETCVPPTPNVSIDTPSNVIENNENTFTTAPASTESIAPIDGTAPNKPGSNLPNIPNIPNL